MTMDDLIACQIQVTCQEAPFFSAASFDRDSANAFQLHVSESLAFAVKRAGFLYGRVDAETKEVLVDFIYVPPQQGSSDVVQLMRDADEEARLDAIADGLGMRRVGFVFMQAVGRKASETGEYTLSNSEVVQAAQLQAEGGIPEWVTAVVNLEVGEVGSADVHFEAFHMSEVCVKLFKDGVLETEVKDFDDPRVSKMRKEVSAGGKDTMEVDNDFFLVPVKISDHQGPLSTGFLVENRGISLSASALGSHMDLAKHLPFVKRISDFHLFLQIAAFLDVKADVPTLAARVGHQAEVPEGYRLLIDALAGSLHSCAYTEVNKDHVDKFREAGLGTDATVYNYMANGSA
uniref:MPN domain-containing protein n=1 Tax=Hordeum vulgare subsp. vulgare TaxID=112509 RepID=A0A8I6X491_HORVV